MIKKVLYVLISLMLFIVCLITSIEISSFDRGFYASKYRELNTYETIGISEVDLVLVTDCLLDYIKDDIDTLDIQANINDITREVFNSKEKSHMVDVKDLYLNVKQVRDISFVIIVVFVVYTILSSKCQLKIFYKVYYKTLCTVLALVISIAIMMMVDFDSLWRLFHQIFFTNDLWLLDPSTDILIMMVPLEFFFDLVIRIVLGFGGSIALISASLFVLKKRGSIND